MRTVRADRLDAWDEAVALIFQNEPAWADQWYETPQAEADTKAHGSAEAERRFLQRRGWDVIPVKVEPA